jgi:hypothetical protein
MPRHLQQPSGGAAVIAMVRVAMRRAARAMLVSAIGAVLVLIPACNNQSGFSGSVGNTPPGPRLPSFEILGNPAGTPFTATLSDARSSWTFQGNTPLSVVLANVVGPSRLVATKTTNNGLLSLEIILGFHVFDVQSTNAPFGTVSVQSTGTLNSIAAPAAPDLRIFLSGPMNQRYQALVEDSMTGFVIDSRAPTLILFDTPNGKVDATFFGGGSFPTWTANMTLDGAVVATVSQGPNTTIREP